MPGAMEDRPVETVDFDAFVGGLDYPVFVVTTVHEDVRAGCLVGFTTQASIDPPRFLVCLSVKNDTYSVARHVRELAVHVLASSQRTDEGDRRSVPIRTTSHRSDDVARD